MIAIPRYEHDLAALLSRHPELHIERNEYNINVTATYGKHLNKSEVVELYIRHDGAGRPAHLYFHVPLCSYICHFCNYVKRLLPEGEQRGAVLDRWVDLLIDESTRYLQRVPWLPQARIESLYIGGGTAALLSESQLARLLDHVRANYTVTPDCELTLEGNPDNFCGDLIPATQAIGFNRFSVGVQSLQDEVNEFTSRGHDSRTSLRAIEKLRSSRLPFNVDMMFGLPYQTSESVGADIAALVELEVPTITIYRLRNADREKMGIGNRAVWNITKVRERLEREERFPSTVETYAMRAAAVEILLNNGYYPSPCGWWNAPGTYPDGNIPRVSRNKWQRYDTMVAFGPGAYGWLTDETDLIVQTHNETDISAYVDLMESSSEPPLASGRLLRGNQALGSALGFAFKANQPIEVERFNRQFGVDILTDEPYRQVILELIDSHFLELSPERETLTPTLDGEALHEEIITVYFHNRIGTFDDVVCRHFS